jgi:AraC-like DNA-binding protein
MTLPLLLFALDVAASVSLSLLAARLLLARPRLPVAQLMALIAVASICHIALARQDYRFWIPAPFSFEFGAAASIALNFARNLTPGLFMVLCHTLFADRRRFPRWLLGAFAAQMLLEVPAHWPALLGPPLQDTVLRALAPLLQTAFAAIALYWTIAGWRGDLIESRRRVRAITTLIIGLDVLVSSVLTRLLVDPDTIAHYYVHEALIGSYLILSVAVLFQFMGDDLDEFLDPVRARPAPPPPRTAEAGAAVARLTALLATEHIYRKPGLTLKALADRAGLPEYRLRKIIHEEFGFANFNAFLHAWRIREACAQLRDPALRRTPVLTIALSVGYQSVNTFNRGFREVMDMAPSEYRALPDAPLPPAPKAA